MAELQECSTQGPPADPSQGETVRIMINIAGAISVVIGSVWVLQGINLLPGSFMTGQTRWAVRGGLAVVVGIAVLLSANRRRAHAN